MIWTTAKSTEVNRSQSALPARANGSLGERWAMAGRAATGDAMAAVLPAGLAGHLEDGGVRVRHGRYITAVRVSGARTPVVRFLPARLLAYMAPSALIINSSGVAPSSG